MKKIILCCLATICTMAYARPPIIDMPDTLQPVYLAKWGLKYCLQYDKENLFKSPIYLPPLREDVAQGRWELKQYFDEEKKLDENIDDYSIRFVLCMNIYQSYEYIFKVMSIYKKYCKDCK